MSGAGVHRSISECKLKELAYLVVQHLDVCVVYI